MVKKVPKKKTKAASKKKSAKVAPKKATPMKSSKKKKTPKAPTKRAKKEIPNGTKGTGMHLGFVKVTGGWRIDASSPHVLCKPGAEKLMEGVVFKL